MQHGKQTREGVGVMKGQTGWCDGAWLECGLAHDDGKAGHDQKPEGHGTIKEIAWDDLARIY